ncbi:MAG: 30S ribosomal protein S12 methylthiotransferase RimO [Gemmatimonadetes bacterium]|nr:30S ribosomal protein S12 methylthiotransferase RimO [Gemmatimonadota bacterium]
MKVGLVTLGCDKNTVDSERYLAQLTALGAVAVDDLREAELIIVNTCGFIDAAKKESLDAIVDAGRLKADGLLQGLVAVGCMVERHKGELVEALPEVDLFLGASESDQLIPALQKRGLVGDVPVLHPGDRLPVSDRPHVRYLKVSEGCDHGCAFCAIPLMRGKHRSFSADEVVREAQLLEMQGAREVNLVAQDLAHYGRDVRDGVGLPELLERLVAETSIPWFRLLYLYGAGLTPKLLDVVARNPRIVPYLDMPVQHGADAVLERMRRPERGRSIRDRVAKVRGAVPDVTIRTTCIVGFPGETDADFDQLLQLLDDVQFDRVGAFTYSAQEGTRAFDLDDDVPDSVKRQRLERLLERQRDITAERYERHLGRVVQCLVEEVGDDGAIARAPWQADDVDGIVRLDAEAPPGAFVRARITDIEDDVDFTAELLEVTSPPPAALPARAERRALPLAPATTLGAFGR